MLHLAQDRAGSGNPSIHHSSSLLGTSALSALARSATARSAALSVQRTRSGLGGCAGTADSEGTGSRAHGALTSDQDSRGSDGLPLSLAAEEPGRCTTPSEGGAGAGEAGGGRAGRVGGSEGGAQRGGWPQGAGAAEAQRASSRAAQAVAAAGERRPAQADDEWEVVNQQRMLEMMAHGATDIQRRRAGGGVGEVRARGPCRLRAAHASGAAAARLPRLLPLLPRRLHVQCCSAGAAARPQVPAGAPGLVSYHEALLHFMALPLSDRARQEAHAALPPPPGCFARLCGAPPLLSSLHSEQQVRGGAGRAGAPVGQGAGWGAAHGR